MTDDRIQLCRQAMREMCREAMRNLNVGEDAVPVEGVARSCQQVCELVLKRLGAQQADATESYAAWLLSERPDGEAA
jgi:hypothetical protein